MATILDYILSTVKEKLYLIQKKKNTKKNKKKVDLPTVATHSEIDG